MDYYEELGVNHSATVSEIRQAYKRLVRLLHPDHCKAESLRRLAELQTKRLNGMLEVLADPAERANYDRGLVAGGFPKARRSVFLPLPSRFWPVLGVAPCTAPPI